MTSPCLVDLYSGDLNGRPNLAAYLAAGAPWSLIVLKATEGLSYPEGASDRQWFFTNWPTIGVLAGDRLGQDFFRGAYHYLRVDQNPVDQADFYMQLVSIAGGVGPGDLPAIVDVEGANNPEGASAQQVIDSVTLFSERIIDVTGKRPILYGGSYLRDRAIVDHMGCQLLWIAAYGQTLPSHLYTSIGWSLDELFAWQYQGTEGPSGPDGYPRQCPIGDGPVDLSAITIADGQAPEAQLAWIRDHLT